MAGTQLGIRGLQRALLVLALSGVAVTIAGAVVDLPALARAYLVAVVTWMAFPLGCLAMLLAWHLAGGRWGLVVGDALEAIVRTLPLLALLFLPVLAGLDAIYPWTRPEFLAAHETVARKAGYLNPPFFIVRSLIYLAIWTGLALILTAPRRRFDERRRRRGLAAASAILYALTASFASIDWILSLQPTFNSSVFGMLVMSGQAVGGYALALLLALGLIEAAGRADLVREHRLIGLGSLFMALVLIWTYFIFIQYLVVWSGDLPHGAEWYIDRGQGVWRAVIAAVAFANGGLPFLVLLSSRARQSWRVLMALAALVVIARVLDGLWLSVPAFGDDAPAAWMIAGTMIAVGGIWLSAVLWLALPRAGWILRAVEAAGRG
jgi:hypothetical protein